jgi:mono/diheme cytochrome c family protein
MRNLIFASVAMALFGACVGGIDTPPPGGDDQPPATTARQLFDQTVSPLLAAKCIGCHVGSETSATNMFLGPDGQASFYNTLVNDRAVNGGYDPAAATILLKGAHEGPAWSMTEVTKISDWLTAELAERGPQGPSGPPTGNTSARGASMAFVSCMSISLTEYTSTQAFQVANLNTQNQGRCSSCHSPGGAGGQWLGTQNGNKDMFAKWQEEVFFTGVFQAQLQPDKTYKIAAAENKICSKGKEKQNNLGTHPTFDCAQNNSTALNNLKAFALAVETKVEMGSVGCPAPAAFAPPTP